MVIFFCLFVFCFCFVFFLPFSISQLVKCLPFYITLAYKGYSFWVKHSRVYSPSRKVSPAIHTVLTSSCILVQRRLIYLAMEKSTGHHIDFVGYYSN